MYLQLIAKGDAFVGKFLIQSIVPVQRAIMDESIADESRCVAELLAKLKPKLPPGAPDLTRSLTLAARMVGPDQQDFAAHMLLANLRLDDAARARRQARFVEGFERATAFIDADHVEAVGIAPDLEEIFTVAGHLIPDSLIDIFGLSMGGWMKRHHADALFGHLERRPASVEGLLAFSRFWNAAQPTVPREVVQLAESVFYSPLELSGEAAKRIYALLKLPDGTLQQVVAAMRQVDIVAHDGMGVFAAEALQRALADFLGNPERGFKGVLNEPLRAADEAVADRYGEALSATLQAASQGVDFGAAAPTVQKMLQQLQAVDDESDARMFDQFRKPAPAPKGGAKGKPAASGAAAAGPAYAWPIDKLVEWIDGPLATRSAKRVDVAELVGRINKKANPAPASAKPGGVAGGGGRGGGGRTAGGGRAGGAAARGAKGAKGATTSYSQQEATAILGEGLRRYAAYVATDVREMTALCHGLNIDAALLEGLTKIDAALQAMSLAKTIDELAARALFEDADECLSKVGAALEREQSSEAFRRDFPRALARCIGAAQIVYGRNFGGEIACPAAPQDWGFVHAGYHNVWAPGIVSLQRGDTTLQLGRDYALAYYVTGTSNSGHAFCVSLHLWRRRAGSAATPCAPDAKDRRIDTAHWTDTRIPCGVFHVPKR